MRKLCNTLLQQVQVGVLLCMMAFMFSGINQSYGQCTPACNQSTQVSLDATCLSEVTSAMILTDPNACPGPKTVQVKDANGNIIPTSPFVNASSIGQVLTAKVIDNQTGNSCWGYIHIEDKLKPVVACQDVTVSCTSNVTPQGLGYPSATDNCDQSVSLSYLDNVIVQTCTSDWTKVITRRWIGTDDYNNKDTCYQHIYVARPNINIVVFPQNLDDIQLPSLSCSPAPNTDPSHTGNPTYDGNPVGDMCNLMVLHSDQQLPLCGGSYKLLRTWTVMDNCTQVIRQQIQVIVVADKQGPTITCPANTTISTSNYDCTSSIVLQNPVISDNCSSYTSTVSAPVPVTNGNTLYGLPIGDNVIVWTAKDACQNTSTCSFTITVQDQIPPTPVCDQNTIISLLPDGTACAYATTFDDGSHDNCGIYGFEVRRMDVANSVFHDQVCFNCDDLNHTIMVALRVWDVNGNSNQCMVNISVQDKIAPLLVCPPDKTVDCTVDYYDLTQMGDATAADGCGYTLTHHDSINVSQCGIGHVWRTWNAIDNSGNSAVCTQTITLVNNHPFHGYDITWPLNYESNACGASLDPDSLPAAYRRPTWPATACAQIMISHDDQFLSIAPPACYKILRKWTVIDWCQFNGNGAGIWTYTQVLVVKDLNAPVITSCPADVTVANLSANCTNQTATFAAVQATDCNPNLNYSYTIDFYNDGQNLVPGTGAAATGSFPNGVHLIKYRVEDGCGNYSICSFKVTVKDGKKPTPVCINGLSVDLMPMGNGGMIQMKAKQFNASSSDNCTATNALKYSFSSNVNDTIRTYTCDDLGTQVVELWVTDQAGNQDYCATYVLIQNNMNACQTSSTSAAISGAIQNESGENVQDVTVKVMGSNAIPTITGPAGSFNFNGIPTGASYQVVPEKTMHPENGVSTFDLVLITRHILQTSLLDSPYKLIAADANHSGTISTSDVLALRKVILGLTSSFPNNTSWRFVKKDYTFPNPSNPFATDFPEVTTISNLSASQQANFIGVKVGDVNGSAQANQLTSLTDHGAQGNMYFDLNEKSFAEGETFTVPFTAQNFDASGFQFTLRFDPATLELVDIKNAKLGVSDDNFGLVRSNEGIITSSWNTEGAVSHVSELFNITFRAKSNGKLSENIRLTSDMIKSEAYASNDDVMDLKLRFDGVTASNDQFELYQNEPNPFRNTTTIGFNLPEAGKTTLKIFDAAGKLLKEINNTYAKGFNQIEISKSELTASGILYYQLSTNNQTATKKMIIVE